MENDKNKVTGRIFHQETGAGISGLVVHVLDADPQSYNPDVDQGLNDPDMNLVEQGTFAYLEQIPGDRLGSTLTDSQGHFELIYDDEDFRVRRSENEAAELRPDLYLVVTTPEPATPVDASRVVFRSAQARVNAGRQEYFAIQLTTADLESAGLPVPSSDRPPADDTLPVIAAPLTFKQQLEKSLVKKMQRRSDIQTVYASFLQAEKQKAEAREQNFLKPFFESISKVQAGLRNNPRLFIAEGESVAEKMTEHIRQTIAEDYSTDNNDNRNKRKMIVHLTDEQFQSIAGNLPDGPVEVTGASARQLEVIARGGNEEGESPVDLIFNDPLSLWCRAKWGSEKVCEALLAEPGEDTPPGDDDSEEPVIINAPLSEEVSDYLARQMENMSAPEDPVQFGAHGALLQTAGRADQEAIERSVSNLSLRQGAADNTAFYDFHHVQIAFEPVWQEVFDQGVTGVAEDLYDKIVDLGIEPVEGNFDLTKYLKNAKTVANFLIKNTHTDIPENVQKVFKIKLDVWQALSSSPTILTTLEENADEIVMIDEAIALLNDVLNLANDGGFIYFSDEENFKAFQGKDLQIKSNPKISEFNYYTKTGAGNLNVHLEEEKIEKKKKELEERKRTLIKEANDLIIVGEQEVEGKKYLDTLPNLKDPNIHEVLRDLEARLKEPYAFKIYAANDQERSVNFGVLVTYRQRWEPLNYQAGELVRTIPLAPKETQKYTKREVRKKRRSTKEIENSLRIIKEDTSDTGRAEAEIMQKAGNTSNYTQNAKGSYDVYLASGTYENTNKGTTAQESRDVKKSFRESVVKAAQEYRNERKLEIATEESFETEYTESGEITNPNDELTVTYLFYELQRTYHVTERIKWARPVIFVAQEMPKPHEIDEDWILSHDWVIRRALLDDSFAPALNFLASGMVGKEIGLEQLRENLKMQRGIVDRLQEQVVVIKAEVNKRYRLFEAAVDKQAGIVAGDGGSSLGFIGDLADTATGLVEDVAGFIFGGSDDGDPKEAARIRREAAMSAYEKAARDRDAMLARLEREVSSLNAITERYTQGVSEYLNMKTQIQRLKVHIKQNILHYMHAIWSHEPTDQRFFRLYNTPVPTFEGTLRYTLNPEHRPAQRPDRLLEVDTTRAYEVEVEPALTPDIQYTTLEQVADMDNLLGFKGNYMIFPLKQSNKLTDFMMAPYLGGAMGAQDPDPLSEWSLRDFCKFVSCLKEKLSEEAFAEKVDDLRAIYNRLLNDPLRQGEEITVPTGSLFIEALPGAHPILEDFKLVHRAMDVKKVQAEVREMELENIRRAARLLEGDLDDPEVEKKIIVEGNGNGVDLNVGG